MSEKMEWFLCGLVCLIIAVLGTLGLIKYDQRLDTVWENANRYAVEHNTKLVPSADKSSYVFVYENGDIIGRNIMLYY